MGLLILVLRRGSKKGLSRRHLAGRKTPFQEYGPFACTLGQKYLHCCREFHDQLSSSLSGAFSEKRGVPSRTEGGRNSGNALDASNTLNYRAWGIPAVPSRGISGNALREFPGSFRNFSDFCPENPSSTGDMAHYGHCHEVWVCFAAAWSLQRLDQPRCNDQGSVIVITIYKSNSRKHLKTLNPTWAQRKEEESLEQKAGVRCDEDANVIYLSLSYQGLKGDTVSIKYLMQMTSFYAAFNQLSAAWWPNSRIATAMCHVIPITHPQAHDE